MRKARSFNCNFTAGELSPQVDAREDLERYRNGLLLHENRYTKIEGGSLKRSGSVFMGFVKNHAQAIRLIPFRSAFGDSYMLEFGPDYVRMWDDGGNVLDGSDPVELATPWGADDLSALYVWRDADVMWVGRGQTQKIQKLSYSGPIVWALGDFDFADGPFLPENVDRDWQLGVTAVTGAGITVNASKVTFTADHVGAIFRYRDSTGAMPGRRWEQAAEFVTGDKARNDGVLYEAQNDGETGSGVPTHGHGDASDGVITWRYLHDGAGIFRVTGYTDTTHVTAEALSHLIHAATGSSFWSEGAFSAVNGYPSRGIILQERHVLGGTIREPDTISFSATGGVSMKTSTGLGVVVATDGFRRTLANEDVNEVMWFAGRENLLIGSTRAEVLITGATPGEGLSPLSARAREVTRHGSDPVMPLTIGDSVLFVQRGGRTIRELSLAGDVESYAAADLTELAQHLTATGLKALAFVNGPTPLVYALRGDGQAIVATYGKAQKVLAWQRVRLGGQFMDGPPIVETLAARRKADGTDELWLGVKRTIGGATRRTVEVMDAEFDMNEALPDDAYFVDCGGWYDGWNHDESRTVTLTGLNGAVGNISTLTANFALFGTDPDEAGVGREILLGRPSSPPRDTDVYPPARVRVTAIASATVASVVLLSHVPDPLRGTALDDFALCAGTVTGLDWLDGETVRVCCDGADGGFAVVTDAEVAVPNLPAGRVAVGYDYGGVFETLNLSPGGPGDLRGSLNRVIEATLSLRGAAGGTYGQAGAKQYPIPSRLAGDAISVAPKLQNRDIRVAVAGSSVLEPRFRVEHREPLPHYIAAIQLTMEIAVDVAG